MGQIFSCRYARWSVNLEVEKISGVVAKTPPPPPTQIQRRTAKTTQDANHANQGWSMSGPCVKLAHHLVQEDENKRSRRYFPTVYYTAITAKDGRRRAEEVNPISLKRRRCNNHLTTSIKSLYSIKVDNVSCVPSTLKEHIDTKTLGN